MDNLYYKMQSEEDKYQEEIRRYFGTVEDGYAYKQLYDLCKDDGNLLMWLNQLIIESHRAGYDFSKK